MPFASFRCFVADRLLGEVAMLTPMADEDRAGALEVFRAYRAAPPTADASAMASDLSSWDAGSGCRGADRRERRRRSESGGSGNERPTVQSAGMGQLPWRTSRPAHLLAPYKSRRMIVIASPGRATVSTAIQPALA